VLSDVLLIEQYAPVGLHSPGKREASDDIVSLTADLAILEMEHQILHGLPPIAFLLPITRPIVTHGGGEFRGFCLGPGR
jgi:hypothetical protein